MNLLRSLVMSLCLVPVSFGGVISFQDFESGSLPGVFSGAGVVTGSGSFSGLGSYVLHAPGGASTTMTLAGLAPHTSLDILFDLLVVDSWDGTTFGCCTPDVFNMNVDGNNILQILPRNFSVIPAQIDSSTAASGFLTLTLLHGDNDNHFGNGGYSDSLWRVSLTGLAHSSSTLTLSFFANGAGWQGGSDESFGLDNITLTTNGASAVPEPATWAVMAGGLLAIVGMRRRRAARR